MDRENTTIFYCAVGLSSAAYCVVLLVAALSPAWRKSSLNWAWLSTIGLYILPIILQLFSDPNNDSMPLWSKDALLFLEDVLIDASISWMLAGGYVAMKRDRGDDFKMAPAVLFTVLISIPIPLTIVILINYANSFYSLLFFLKFFNILDEVQFFMIAFSCINMYTYGLCYIRRSHSKNYLTICVSFLIFAVYLLCHSILVMIIMTMLDADDDNDLANTLLYNLPTIDAFAVFFSLIIHLVFNRENIQRICKKIDRRTDNGDEPNERLSLEAK